MDANRRTAVIAGVVWIVATVAEVIGAQLSKGLLAAPNYLAQIHANASPITVGGMLELIAAGACAGVALSLYPVLMAWSPGLALGAVAFRTIEAIMYVVGVAALLSLLPLSGQFATASTANQGAIQVAGDSFLALRGEVVIPAVIAFGLGALMYYWIFWQSGLVPRWLSGWGIAAIVLMLGAAVVAWFTQTPVTNYVIVMLPIAVQEMVIAVWLIVKGFSPTALRSRSVSRISAAVAG